MQLTRTLSLQAGAAGLLIGLAGCGGGEPTTLTEPSAEVRPASILEAVETEAATAKAFADANDGQPPPEYFLVGDGPEIGPKQ